MTLTAEMQQEFRTFFGDRHGRTVRVHLRPRWAKDSRSVEAVVRSHGDRFATVVDGRGEMALAYEDITGVEDVA